MADDYISLDLTPAQAKLLDATLRGMLARDGYSPRQRITARVVLAKLQLDLQPRRAARGRR